MCTRPGTDAGLQPSIRPARRQRQQSPTFHCRGINSQDTSETAAARAERTAKQRNHRTRRRDGETPSPTSPLSEMLRQRQPVPILPSPMPPPPEIQRAPRDAVTLQPDPPLDFSDADCLNNPALSRDDVKLLRKFHNAIYAAKQELCALPHLQSSFKRSIVSGSGGIMCSIWLLR